MGSCATKLQKEENTKLLDITETNQNAIHKLFVKESNDVNECKCDSKRGNLIDNCFKLKRILSVLNYYSSLDMTNTNQQEIFSNVITETYSDLLNDYIHLINEHNNDLHEIQLELISKKQYVECDITNCNLTTRHNCRRYSQKIYEIKNANILDRSFNFYVETMDGLHFYIFHLFDCGLRILHDEYATNEEINDQYLDASFCQMNKIISQKKSITKSFDRFETDKNKFTIAVENSNQPKIGDDTTFLDEIYNSLLNDNVDDDHVNKLRALISAEQYDSDTINEDIEHIGNISNYINHKQCIDSIKHFIQTTKIRSSSFSIGLRFYYWNFYETIQDVPEKEIANNVNDHNGYNISQLFIKQKYSSFKEEISNYKYISMQQYEDNVVLKARNYKDTEIVKSMYAVVNRWSGSNLHYDINHESKLFFHHLLAVILYTDFSDLSTDFSSTFRKIAPFESLSSIKLRNGEYYWLSKILRETVELYGRCGYEEDKNGGLSGPFYCGMTCVMHMPGFNIRLCSPTSTSMQIEVAIKFSGDDGMILQFNNVCSPADLLRGFNCSWISRYKEEDERLFFGGQWMIKIESIRIRRTAQNFKKFMHSLYYFDNMITGGNFTNMKIKTAHTEIIKCLINHTLGKQITKKIDPYIYSTFECFCQSKQQIALDLYQLKKADEKMRNLIMYSMDECVHFRVYKEEKARVDTDFRNLFRSQIFQIFKNIKTVIIKTTSVGGILSYSLSIFGLLSLIEPTSVNKVIVKAVAIYGESNNWITSLWTSSSTIKKKYNEQNYSISVKHISKYGSEDWMEICRKR
eukprot:462515_1